jgi:hypothetical protein
MTGHASGLKVSLFDYTFTTGVGRTSTDKTQTIAAFEKNGIQMPEFALQSEGMLQKVGDAFSQKDIDFESHPEFSNRFQLRSSQEGRTRRVFTRSLLDFLTDVELGEVWRIEGVDATLLIYGRNKQVKPEDYPAFFRESSFLATEFFKRCGANKPG